MVAELVRLFKMSSAHNEKLQPIRESFFSEL